MELILIRHPAPQVAPGICYGSTDLPADPDALASCHAAIVTALPPSLLRAAPVWTSPLRRCSALAAQLVAGRPVLPAPSGRIAAGAAIADARLAELHFGAWEHRAWDDIPRPEVDAWTADLLNYRPGGGESVLDAATRVQSFLRDLPRPTPAPAQATPIIVCHAGTIRLIQALATGAPLREAAMRAATAPHAIAYGSIHRVIIE